VRRATPVRFSTRAPNADYLGFEASPEAIVTAAKKAEEVGFDAIFVNDQEIAVGSIRAFDQARLNHFPRSEEYDQALLKSRAT
jgi:alkanesulfonate monooxygenase SsuD/methylene tetrahydromethanopterin reductase-like flavin-dependent oxidoreductase (luciferase family)